MEEIWKPIEKFYNEYEVSNLGRIRSTKKLIYKRNGSTYTRISKVLKPALSTDGYLKGSVCFMRKMVPYTLHRLVAEAFCEKKSDALEVNHINGIKNDNRAENLEWVTHSENCKHSFDIGLQKPKRGSLNGMSKLTDDQVRMVRKMKSDGGRFWGRNEIAKELGIAPKHLQKIVNGKVKYRSWIGV